MGNVLTRSELPAPTTRDESPTETAISASDSSSEWETTGDIYKCAEPGNSGYELATASSDGRESVAAGVSHKLAAASDSSHELTTGSKEWSSATDSGSEWSTASEGDWSTASEGDSETFSTPSSCLNPVAPPPPSTSTDDLPPSLPTSFREAPDAPSPVSHSDSDGPHPPNQSPVVVPPAHPPTIPPAIPPPTIPPPAITPPTITPPTITPPAITPPAIPPPTIPPPTTPPPANTPPTSTITDQSYRRNDSPNQPSASDGDGMTSSPTLPPVPPPSTSTDQPSHSPPTGPPMDSERLDQARTGGDAPTYPPLVADKPSAKSLTSRELSTSDLPVLLTVLGNAAHCSEQLGYKLLSSDLVLTLKGEAMGVLAAFLSKVLTVRLQVLPALTVQELADALSQPPINNGALAQKLRQQFLPSTSHLRNPQHSSTNPPDTPPPSLTTTCLGELCVGPAPYSPVTRYADYLTAYYNTAPIALDTKLPLKQANKFINLASVLKERTSRAEVDAFTRATLHGQIDEVYRKKKPVRLEDVLKPEEGQEEVKLLLVEGAPGIGKSTFAWELCREWHVLQRMQKYSLVVLLRFRETRVQQASRIADLFYHSDASLQQAVAEEVSAREGAQTLLILDGFDEAAGTVMNNPFLVEILQGKCLPKATVVITSRPSARAQLLSLCGPKVSKHIEILGFLDDQVSQYIDSTFGDNPGLRDDFLKYISTHPPIKSMTYIPLICAIIAEVYRDNRTTGRPIPQTMTQLYTDMTLATLWRYQSRECDQPPELLPDSLDSLPEDLDTQLHNLAELAFQGIVKQKVIFSSLPDNCSPLDLMDASTELYLGRRARVSYSFFHLTLQEFLAAVYVSRLPPSEQKNMFECYSARNAHPNMDVVWRFVAGLTGFRCIGWEMVMARRGRDGLGRILSFLVHCLYETQEEAVCRDVLGEGMVQFLAYNCSLFAFFALGYCISASRCSWDLSLDGNSLGPDAAEMLVSGLVSREEVHGTISRLSLGGNRIKREGSALLKTMPQKNQISDLSLSDCDLDGAALDILSDMMPTMTSLKNLNIGYNKPGAGGAVNLLLALAHLPRLEILYMSHMNIGCEDIRALSKLISPSDRTTLKRLTIGGDSMSPECVELMMTTLLSPSSLVELGIHKTNFTSSRNCFTLLQGNSNLRTLIAVFCPIGSHTTSSLARALQTNSTLEDLCINSAHTPVADQIGTEGAVALSLALESNTTLKELRLWHDESMGDTGARALVNTLQHNRTLRSLELPHYYSHHFSSVELDPRVRFGLP